MIEALDWQQFVPFLAKCAALLTREGRAVIQAITIDDLSYDRARRSTDFIKSYIFPGGCLPSVASLLEAISSATDFQDVQIEKIGLHYPATLRAWQENVDRNEPQLHSLGLDDAFFRMWRCYLSYCEGAFLEGHVNDVQILMAKPESIRIHTPELVAEAV